MMDLDAEFASLVATISNEPADARLAEAPELPSERVRVAWQSVCDSYSYESLGVVWREAFAGIEACHASGCHVTQPVSMRVIFAIANAHSHFGVECSPSNVAVSQAIRLFNRPRTWLDVQYSIESVINAFKSLHL